jgi:hypothetical protein
MQALVQKTAGVGWKASSPQKGLEAMQRTNPPFLTRTPVLLAIAGLLLLVGYFGWRALSPSNDMSVSEGSEAASAVAADPETPKDVAEPVVPPVPEEPAIENPVEDIQTALPAEPFVLPALADADPVVNEAVSSLLSRKNVLTYLQMDGLVRRVVATVDNLPRSQASSKLWPVNPTPKRFSTQKGADGVEHVHADNHKRYGPLVQGIEAVNTDQAVVMYRSFYPLFQQAYEELGFPNGYFNDRLVQVLDHLIATPIPNGPLSVTLVDVKGEIPSLRPWVRYEYADPELQAMSAGRKMLVRVGSEQQRRLQAKLREIRQRVAKP